MTPETVIQPDFIIDRIYGRIDVTPGDLKLFQTKELIRTRNISLAAIPPQVLYAGMCDTRFHHSIGVAHLAKALGKKPEFKQVGKDLYFAALLHDIGHPPFSHSSDYFQQLVLGKNHEEVVPEILHGSKLAKKIESQGGSMDNIIHLIQGNQKPFSDLLNGSVDIDNLDNVLRYAMSIGLIHKATYSPEKITDSYSLSEGGLIFLPGVNEDLREWEKTRKLVYDFVDSPVNKAIAMMMFRGLAFALEESELDTKFFFMGDYEALNYLINKCNPKTSEMFKNIANLQFYQQVFDFSINNPSNKVKNILENRENRILLADEISEELQLNPEEVCVYVGKSKGVRQIHIPILDQNGNSTNYQPLEEQEWMARVYVHLSQIDKALGIREYMSAKLN